MKIIYQRLAVFCFAMLSFFAIEAQTVSILPLQANNDYFFIDQLWQVTLTNLGNAPVNGVLEIRLETNTHTPIITATTASATWNRGVNTLSGAARATMQVVYGTNELGATLRETGRLPFGQYILCYTCRQPDGVQLGISCQEKTIRPISPPELINPTNGSSVETTRPLLMWRGPFPLQSEGLRYSLRLTEVPAGTTPLVALNTRPLIINLTNHRDQFLPYPATAQPLDTGKVYAWQVSASAGNFQLGTTDVWTFRVVKPIPDSLKKRYQSYCWVKDYEDGTFCYPTDTLKFVYDNQVRDTVLNFVVVNKDNDTLPNPPQIRLTPGINAIKIPLQRLGSIENGDLYRLIITDAENRRYTLPFRKRRNR